MKNFKKIILFLLCLTLTLTCLPAFAEEAPTDVETVNVESQQVPFMLASVSGAVYAPAKFTPGIFDYYAENVLAGCPDAQRFYAAIVEACSRLEIGMYRQRYTLPQIVVTNISNVDLFNQYRQKVFPCIFTDRAEYFWFYSVSYTYSFSGNTFTCTITADASSIFISDDHMGLGRKMMDDAVTEILANRPKGQDVFETLAYFNDWLCEHNTYCEAAGTSDVYQYANTILPAFASNNNEQLGPVCQSYAGAFKHLCNLVGIPCVTVMGFGYTDPGSGGAHAWNAVKIDGVWYANDTTWNDSLNLWGSHFLVGSQTVTRDWYGTQSIAWFGGSHIPGMMYADGTEYLDNKYPTLDAHSYKPKVKGEGLAETKADMVILPLGVHTVSDVTDLIENTSLITFKKSNSVLPQSGRISTGVTATLAYQGKTYDTKTIAVRGDLNGDGKVSSIDYVMLRQYFSGTNYTGATAAASDINGDGNILTSDYFLLKTYFNGGLQ